MRVLITGAGGFLAGHLLAHLQAIGGIEVRSLSRAECDLSRDQEKLIATLRTFQPDTIFHLAGRLNGSEAELTRDNQLATKNLLEAAQAGTPAATRIVLGSSTAVYGYGGTAVSPLSEEEPSNPLGPYGRSKYGAEQEACAYARSGRWIVTARISNPVGSGMSATLLGGSLARQIVEIERGRAPILTLRDLRPKRDFIAVRDCARALWHLAERGETGGVYNVATGESMSIGDLVLLFLALARVRPIAVRSFPTDEERSSVSEQWLSNARLRALGWKPEQTLRQAIGDLLDAERNRS